MTAVPYAEVIGDPISHSKSPLIHNFWLERLGLNGDYRRKLVHKNELAAYFETRRADLNWRGCNVTMPHKQAAVQILDKLDELAGQVGAINAVVPEHGMLTGYNTDAAGFLEAFERGPRQSLPENYVATLFDLIGAGGAARAVASALRGNEVTIYNRTRIKADQLADEIGLGSAYGFSGGLEDLKGDEIVLDRACPELRPNRGVDQRYNYVIINASAMGMTGNPPVPVPLEKYPDNTLVVDIVYDPVETPLLQEAKRLRLPTLDGLSILVAQAARAFELFFGTVAPRKHDAELRELLLQ